jgi:hypothetical protein
MKFKLILTTAIVGTALALPSVSSAAPPAPTFQDSVSLTEAPAIFPSTIVNGFVTIEELTATSGPSGENPTGEIMLNVPGNFSDSGPITCLAVSGNTATFSYASNFLSGGIVTVEAVDNNPDTVAIFAVGSDCTTPQEGIANPLISGDITVVDAQPPPTTKDQCKNGGWRNFAQFTNQGQCIAFVTHGP